MRSTTFLATLLPALAAAAPTGSTADPNKSTAQRFNLIAKVNTDTPSIDVDGYAVVAWHSGAGTARAVLVKQDNGPSDNTPWTFYQNGTAADVANGRGQLSADVGQPDPLARPYGFLIASPTEPHEVDVNLVNYGTPNTAVDYFVHVNRFADEPVSYDTFYACMGTTAGETVPQLFWRHQGESTPNGCQELALWAQCAGDVTIGSGKEFVQPTNCLIDANKV